MRYEDFSQAGLVLIGPSSSGYESLISQIKARHLRSAGQSDDGAVGTSLDNFHIADDPRKSVVFFNKSKKSVVLLQVLWRFELPDGREVAGSCAWAGAENLLLPFEIPSEMRPAMKYRWAILPGSKRYITNAGEVIGDNTDVRPPSAGEIWKGGVVSGFGGGYMEPKQVVRLSICMEGAFFDDGEFAGTNRTKLFEQIVAKANAHAKIAEMASQKGKSAGSILDEIQKTASGVKASRRPPLIPEANTPLSVYEEVAFEELAENVRQYRAFKGDAGTLESIRSWAAVELSAFRRLAGPAS